jgi:hypothetical protein
MIELREGVARLLGRVLAELPAWIVKKIPDWIAGAVKGYVRWLWNLDIAMKVVMLLVNVIALQLLLGSLSAWGLAPLAIVLTLFFFGASVVFGGRRK